MIKITSDKKLVKEVKNAECTQSGRMTLTYLLTCAKDGTMKYISM